MIDDLNNINSDLDSLIVQIKSTDTENFELIERILKSLNDAKIIIEIIKTKIDKKKYE